MNSYTSPECHIKQAGLPQGSHLSPILYANLVQVLPIGDQSGSMAFVGDYTAWIVGDLEDSNCECIQSTIIQVGGVGFSEWCIIGNVRPLLPHYYSEDGAMSFSPNIFENPNVYAQ